MIKNSAKVLRQAKTIFCQSRTLCWKTRETPSLEPVHRVTMETLRDSMNQILESNGFERAKFPGQSMAEIRFEIEFGYDRIRDHISAHRSTIREAKKARERAQIDQLRPQSAGLQQPPRPRTGYSYPPKPSPNLDGTIPAGVMSLDRALAAVRAIIETLPDDTRLPASMLNATYLKEIRRRQPDDQEVAEGDDIENYLAEHGLISVTPRRINTVADLKAISHQELVAMPRVGRRTIINLLAAMAKDHGLDCAFAADPARIVPQDPTSRVLHALHTGLVVVWDKHESHTGRMHKCLRAYEKINGKLVETERTAAYNETDGYAVGMGNVPWHKQELVAWSTSGNRRILSLSAAGQKAAAKLLQADVPASKIAA